MFYNVVTDILGLISGRRQVELEREKTQQQLAASNNSGSDNQNTIMYLSIGAAVVALLFTLLKK